MNCHWMLRHPLNHITRDTFPHYALRSPGVPLQNEAVRLRLHWLYRIESRSAKKGSHLRSTHRYYTIQIPIRANEPPSHCPEEHDRPHNYIDISYVQHARIYLKLVFQCCYAMTPRTIVEASGLPTKQIPHFGYSISLCP